MINDGKNEDCEMKSNINKYSFHLRCNKDLKMLHLTPKLIERERKEMVDEILFLVSLYLSHNLPSHKIHLNHHHHLITQE